MLTLFVAAASVLPPNEIAAGESLRRFFDEDGRFGLLALAAFNVTALAVNHVFWSPAPLTFADAINVILIVLPVVGFFGRRRIQVAATLAYAVGMVVAITLLSPPSY